MKKIIWLLFILVLPVCFGILLIGVGGALIDENGWSQIQDGGVMDPSSLTLDDYGPAPEWDNDIWLNTEVPLRLADLRGKVVLIEMWSFG
jgi:hypothetical protein